MKKIFTLLGAGLLAVCSFSANALDTIYLVGGGTVDGKALSGSPGTSNCIAVTGTNNVFTFEVENISWLKISDSNSSSWDTFNDNGFCVDGQGDYTLTTSQLGSSLKLWYGYANNINPPTKDKYKYTLTVGAKSSSNSTLVVEAVGDVKVEYPQAIYIASDYNNWASDNASYKLSPVDSNGHYQMTGLNMPSGKLLKFTNGTWDVNWGAQSENAAIPIGSQFTPKLGGGNYSLNVDLVNATVDFNYDLSDPSKSTVTITNGSGEYTEPVPDNLYLIGSIDGTDWDLANPLSMDNEGDGFFSASNVVITGAEGGADGYISLTSVKGSSKDDWTTVNANRYGPATDGTPITGEIGKEEEYEFTKSENAWKLPPGTYNFNVSFEDMILAVENVTPVQTLNITGEDPTVKDQGEGFGGITATFKWTVSGEPTVDFKNVKIYYQILKNGETSNSFETEGVQNYNDGTFGLVENRLDALTPYVVNAYAEYNGTKSNTWSKEFTTPAVSPTITFTSAEATPATNSAVINVKYATTNWKDSYSVKIEAWTMSLPDDFYGTGDATNGTVTVSKLESGKPYTFTVILHLMDGENEITKTQGNTVTFTTEAAPTPTITWGGYEVTSTTTNSAVVKINYTTENMPEGATVKITAQDGQNPFADEITATGDATSGTLEFNDLEEDTDYSYTVILNIISNGSSLASTIGNGVEFKTLKAQTLTLTGEFAGVKDQGEGMGGITATIKWTLTGDPVIEDYDSAKVYYQLAKKDQTPSEVQDAMHNTGDSYQATLNYLDAATDYVITAYAEYNGVRSETNTLEFSTNDLPPTITFGSYEAETTETTADITFKYTTTNWKEGYSVKIYSFDLGDWDRPEDISYNGGESEGTLHITDLQPGKEYSYSVTLYVMNGDTQLANAESKIITFTTQKAASEDVVLTISKGEVAGQDRGSYGGATLSMNWEVTTDPQVEDASAVKLFYQVVKDGNSATDEWSEATYNYGSYRAEKTDLEYNTKYTVLAYAQYETFESAKWTYEITTPVASPTIAWGDYSPSVTANSATVTFNYTTTNWSDDYTVKIEALDNETYASTFGTGNATTGTIEFTDLEPGTEYNYVVLLYVMKGNETLARTLGDGISFTTSEATTTASLKLNESGISYNVYPNASVSFTVNESAITSENVADDAVIDVYYQLNGADSYTKAENNGRGSYTFDISGLNYQTQYQVNIYAATGEGTDMIKSNTVNVIFTTPAAQASVNVISVEESDVTSTTATVTVSVVSENVPEGGSVKVYLTDDDSIDLEQTVAAGQQTATFNLTGLTEGTSYVLYASAQVLNSHDDVVANSMEMSVEINTPADVIPATVAIENATAAAEETTAVITVSYAANNIPEGAMIYAQAMYEIDGDRTIVKTDSQAASEDGVVEVNLDNLTADTNYEVLVNLYLTDADGNIIAGSNPQIVNFTTEASAITAIEAEMLEGVRYFDLNGHEINRQPAPGIYIRVKDNKATKVIIK